MATVAEALAVMQQQYDRINKLREQVAELQEKLGTYLFKRVAQDGRQHG